MIKFLKGIQLYIDFTYFTWKKYQEGRWSGSVGHKHGKVYSVKLNDGLYEESKLLYSCKYISCSNYVTWFLEKKTKGTRERIKRKHVEDDENVQINKNPKRMKH